MDTVIPPMCTMVPCLNDISPLSVVAMETGVVELPQSLSSIHMGPASAQNCSLTLSDCAYVSEHGERCCASNTSLGSSCSARLAGAKVPLSNQIWQEYSPASLSFGEDTRSWLRCVREVEKLSVMVTVLLELKNPVKTESTDWNAHSMLIGSSPFPLVTSHSVKRRPES